jgi:hypothetical protein
MANLMLSPSKNCCPHIVAFWLYLIFPPIGASNQVWRDERNKIIGWKLHSFVSNNTKYFPCTKESRQDKKLIIPSIFPWNTMYPFPILNTFFSPLVLLLTSKKEQAKMKEWGTTQERMNQTKKTKNTFHPHKFPIIRKLQRHFILQNKLLS